MSKPYVQINTATDTFSGWVTKTNDILNDMSNIIVTTDQGAGTGVTTGNAHIQGILSSNTLIATGSLRGGNTSVSGNLTISSNTIFSGATVTSVANTQISGNLTLNLTNRALAVASAAQFSGSFTMANTAQAFAVTAQSITESTPGAYSLTAGSATFNANITIPNGFTITANGTSITSLNATQLTTGTVPDARIASTIARSNITISTPANAGITGGGNLTANRTLVVDGSIIPYLANNQTFSGTNTFPNLRTSGNVLPTANNTHNIGSTTMVYANMYATLFNGTATSARYADLAERYLADAEYDVGTVIAVGGTAEVTAADTSTAHSVIGVVSQFPAYLMNSELEGGTAIALKGRVPVKVIGDIVKGDRLVPSGTPGFATADNNDVGRAFAIALENGSNLVEAVIL